MKFFMILSEYGIMSAGLSSNYQKYKMLLRRLAVVFIAFSVLAGCGTKENEFTEYDDPTVIGSTINPLTTYYHYMASCEQGLGDMAADAMRWKGIGADFALINAGSVRVRGVSTPTQLDAGPITLGDVTEFMPFDNAEASNPSTIVMISITSLVLKEVMENSFSRMASNAEPGTSFGRFLQISNFTVGADVRNSARTVDQDGTVTNPGSRIWRLRRLDNSELIDFSDTVTEYRVALPSKYIKNSPGNQDWDGYWEIFAKGTNIVDTNVLIYDAIVEYIQTFSPMTYSDPSECLWPATPRMVISHD